MYVRGHAVTLGLVGLACCAYSSMSFSFVREINRRWRGSGSHNMTGMSEDAIEELGDRNPNICTYILHENVVQVISKMLLLQANTNSCRHIRDVSYINTRPLEQYCYYVVAVTC